MSGRWHRFVGACALSAFCAPFAMASPWLAPGDESLRGDIQSLADAGILRGPVTTWPLSWPDVARDAQSASVDRLDDATAEALLRIQRLASLASTPGFSSGVSVSAAHRPSSARGFADTPREEGELGVGISWLGDHVAVNAQATFAADPDDDKKIRADGSYVGVNIGNFMVSAGYMERWWGPGWDGSLILSTNARPIPSLMLERNYTDPFRTRWLSWLGHWRASIAVGEAETHEVAVPEVRFLAARVNFKPRPWLEVGLSRTAQWCGGDRPCGWETFTDMLLGRDNQVAADGALDGQPGNQMAGYDVRLRSPWRPLPVALYAQAIGEDEAGGLPAKFTGLMGVETWGSSRLGGWRLRAEYADTACNFSREQPLFECAYRSSIYPQGYTYRGRVIGHSIDNDSRLYTVGASLVRPDGTYLGISFKRLELNRDGGPHAISAVPLDVERVEFRYSREWGIGKLTASIGYEDPAIGGDRSSRFQGFVKWQQGF